MDEYENTLAELRQWANTHRGEYPVTCAGIIAMLGRLSNMDVEAEHLRQAIAEAGATIDARDAEIAGLKTKIDDFPCCGKCDSERLAKLGEDAIRYLSRARFYDNDNVHNCGGCPACMFLDAVRSRTP